MRMFWFARIVISLAIAAAGAWFVHETRWVEITVDEGQHGLAADDDAYTLRRLLQASGTTLETRTSLDPLPPPGATLVLESTFWNIFPGRDERLQAWVRAGGHLVIDGLTDNATRDLRWLPLTFATPRSAKPHKSASAPGDVVGLVPPAAGAPPKRASSAPHPFDKPFELGGHGNWQTCEDFHEPDDTPQPAFEPGRTWRGCTEAQSLRALPPATPVWSLVDAQKGVLTMRVPYGQGSVTGVSFRLVIGNRELLQSDNGLIASAIVQAAPGHVVWLVQDESREALPLWMWHEARTPTLLIAAAILLALWRLLPRFGPREARPAPARRSMGEQVRGTGQFIAASEPRALHAAARQAFDAVGRTRIDAWNQRNDAERVAALADALAPTTTLDRAALLAALAPPAAAKPDQILAATAVIEQARRALLRTPIAPFAN